MGSKVKVAVRVRPFNKRGIYTFVCSDFMTLYFSEIALGTKGVIDMDDTQTVLESVR